MGLTKQQAAAAYAAIVLQSQQAQERVKPTCWQSGICTI
jgi:hypothetical protein